ncbi:MAG TPA: hypothetical protein PKD53_03475 [Chloroflexaceae bacterium]|nr:hypothetical protein [Chloroflexaceae bacterium]
MPPPKRKRLQRRQVDADRKVVEAVATLPDYAPQDPRYSVEALQQLVAVVAKAQGHEARLDREAALVRDQVIFACDDLHDRVKGLKLHVEAQYGSDSPAVYTIGFKRTSERKRPERRKKGGA